MKTPMKMQAMKKIMKTARTSMKKPMKGKMPKMGKKY